VGCVKNFHEGKFGPKAGIKSIEEARPDCVTGAECNFNPVRSRR
jgi:hypothetical protein